MFNLADLKTGSIFTDSNCIEYEVLANRTIDDKWGEMIYCLNIDTRMVEFFQKNTGVNFKYMR